MSMPRCSRRMLGEFHKVNSQECTKVKNEQTQRKMQWTEITGRSKKEKRLERRWLDIWGG